MSDLDALIEQLEKAEVGSRELDAEIARVLGLPPLYEDETDSGPIPVWSLYTASIDDALTLVPEGWTRDVDATAPAAGIDVRLHPDSGYPVIGTHREEAVATVLAALRAKEPRHD